MQKKLSATFFVILSIVFFSMNAVFALDNASLSAENTPFEPERRETFGTEERQGLHGRDEATVPNSNEELQDDLFETDVTTDAREGSFVELERNKKNRLDALDPLGTFGQPQIAIPDTAVVTTSSPDLPTSSVNFPEERPEEASYRTVSAPLPLWQSLNDGLIYLDSLAATIRTGCLQDASSYRSRPSEISETPEPSTFLLLLSGIIFGWGVLRRTRKKKGSRLKFFGFLIVFSLGFPLTLPEASSQSLLEQAYRLMTSGDTLVESGEYWEALEQYEQARQLYQAADFPLGEGIALDDIGLVSSQLELYQQTILSFQDAAALFKSIEDRDREVTTLNQLALVYSRLKKYLSALQTLQEVLLLEEERDNRLNEGRTQNNIGAVYMNLGRYDKARERLDTALEIARKVNDAKGEAKALVNIGAIYRTHGINFYKSERYSEAKTAFQVALALYQQALDLQQAVGESVEESAAYLNLGQAHRDLGRNYRESADTEKSRQEFLEALSAFQEALEGYTATAYRTGIATALGELGETYLDMQEYDESLLSLQQALDIFRDLGDAEKELYILAQLNSLASAMNDKQAQAAHLLEMGDMYFQQGHYTKADDLLWDALYIQEEIADEIGLATSLMLLGEIAIHERRYDDAFMFLPPALEIWQAELEEENTARALLDIGWAHVEHESCDDAIDPLQQARLMYQELDHRRGEGKALLLLGKAYFHQGDEAAFSTLEQAQSILREIDDFSGAGQALMSLGQFEARQDNFSSAAGYFEQALDCYRDAEELAGQAQVHTHIGDLFKGQERYSDAILAYQDALELYRELEDRDGEFGVLSALLPIRQSQGEPIEEAGILMEIAAIHLSREESDEAMTVLQQASDIYSSAGDLAGPANTAMLRGEAFRQRREYAQALSSLQTALDIYRDDLNDSAGEADTLSYIGTVYFSQAQASYTPDEELSYLQQAEESYQQAIALYQSLGDRKGEGNTLLMLGKVYSRQAELAAGDDAERLFAQAIETKELAYMILAEVDDYYAMIQAQMSLGETYARMGLYWDALEAYRRALGIMHETDFFMASLVLDFSTPLNKLPIDSTLIQRGIAESLNNLGETGAASKILKQTLDTSASQADVDEALELVEDLRELDVEDDALDETADILKEMAEEQQEQGNTDEAVELLEEALDLERETHDYEDQQEVVEKIEELDPEYVQRTVSGLDDDANWFDDESSSSASSSEPTAQTDDRTRRRRTSNRGSEPGLPAQKSTLPKAPVVSEEKRKDEQFETAKNQSDPPRSEERRSRVHTSTRPQESPAELKRKSEIFNDIGLVHLRQGAFQKAGRYFLSAQLIQEAIGDEHGKASTLSNRATLHYMLGQFEEAGNLYLASQTLMKTFQDIEGEVTVLNHLALLYSHRGRFYEMQQEPKAAETFYAEALDTFRKAIDLSQSLDKKALQGTLLNNQGLVYYQLMLFYREAGQQAETQESALACYQHSVVIYQLALKSYQESLEIIRESGGRAGESATLHNIGKVYAVLELDSKALDYFWQALELERATSNYIDEARTLSDIGYIYERQGRNIVREARELLDLTDFENLSGLTEFSKGAFTLQQALGFYEQAIEIQESLRTKARLEEFKISFAEESANVYQQSVLLLMAMNSPELAFNMTERARARAFLDTAGTVRPDMLRGIPQKTAERVPALRKEIQRVYRALRHEQEQPLFMDNREKIDRLKSDLDRLEARYDELLMEMKLTHPKYASLLSVDPLKLQEIQSLLDAEESLISYFVTPQKLLAFVLKQDSFDSVELLLKAETLHQEIVDLRKSDDKQDPQHEGLAQLHEWLIEPVSKNLDSFKLRIAPHGLLHYLPFAALYNGERYLNDEYQLSMIPSGSVLQFLSEETQVGVSANAFVIGNEGYPPLKYAEEEARSIAALYQGGSAIGEHATIAAFQNAADKTGMIHFAGHAGLDRLTPGASGLLLDDGYLTIRDIYALDLSRSGLVVLSACNTNIGPQSRGDDIIALNRAFLSAGASAVVASLWSVNDEAASRLMLAFHEHRRQGVNAAEALRRAQIDTRRDFPNPKYWAAFVLTGNPGI